MGLFSRKKKKQEETTEKSQGFAGSVIFGDVSWNKEKLIKDLENDWGIVDSSSEDSSTEDIMFINYGEYTIVAMFLPVRIPNNEIGDYAKFNYMWPGAKEVENLQKSNLFVTVKSKNSNLIEESTLLVKVLSTCCKQDNVLAIYSVGTVFEPKFYQEAASIIQKGQFPILNLIWFGLYNSEGGASAYTYGLTGYGKMEFEIINSSKSLEELRYMLLDLVSYVIFNDVTINDGETIGSSAEEKILIIESKGVRVPNSSLKIDM